MDSRRIGPLPDPGIQFQQEDSSDEEPNLVIQEESDNEEHELVIQEEPINEDDEMARKAAFMRNCLWPDRKRWVNEDGTPREKIPHDSDSDEDEDSDEPEQRVEADQPIDDEPVADEPVADEPVADEPIDQPVDHSLEPNSAPLCEANSDELPPIEKLAHFIDSVIPSTSTTNSNDQAASSQANLDISEPTVPVTEPSASVPVFAPASIAPLQPVITAVATTTCESSSPALPAQCSASISTSTDVDWIPADVQIFPPTLSIDEASEEDISMPLRALTPPAGTPSQAFTCSKAFSALSLASSVSPDGTSSQVSRIPAQITTPAPVEAPEPSWTTTSAPISTPNQIGVPIPTQAQAPSSFPAPSQFPTARSRSSSISLAGLFNPFIPVPLQASTQTPVEAAYNQAAAKRSRASSVDPYVRHSRAAPSWNRRSVTPSPGRTPRQMWTVTPRDQTPVSTRIPSQAHSLAPPPVPVRKRSKSRTVRSISSSNGIMMNSQSLLSAPIEPTTSQVAPLPPQVMDLPSVSTPIAPQFTLTLGSLVHTTSKSVSHQPRASTSTSAPDTSTAPNLTARPTIYRLLDNSLTKNDQQQSLLNSPNRANQQQQQQQLIQQIPAQLQQPLQQTQLQTIQQPIYGWANVPGQQQNVLSVNPEMVMSEQTYFAPPQAVFINQQQLDSSLMPPPLMPIPRSNRRSKSKSPAQLVQNRTSPQFLMAPQPGTAFTSMSNGITSVRMVTQEEGYSSSILTSSASSPVETLTQQSVQRLSIKPKRPRKPVYTGLRRDELTAEERRHLNGTSVNAQEEITNYFKRNMFGKVDYSGKPKPLALIAYEESIPEETTTNVINIVEKPRLVDQPAVNSTGQPNVAVQSQQQQQQFGPPRTKCRKMWINRHDRPDYVSDEMEIEKYYERRDFRNEDGTLNKDLDPTWRRSIFQFWDYIFWENRTYIGNGRRQRKPQMVVQEVATEQKSTQDQSSIPSTGNQENQNGQNQENPSLPNQDHVQEEEEEMDLDYSLSEVLIGNDRFVDEITANSECIELEDDDDDDDDDDEPEDPDSEAAKYGTTIDVQKAILRDVQFQMNGFSTEEYTDDYYQEELSADVPSTSTGITKRMREFDFDENAYLNKQLKMSCGGGGDQQRNAPKLSHQTKRQRLASTSATAVSATSTSTATFIGRHSKPASVAAAAGSMFQQSLSTDFASRTCLIPTAESWNALQREMMNSSNRQISHTNAGAKKPVEPIQLNNELSKKYPDDALMQVFDSSVARREMIPQQLGQTPRRQSEVPDPVNDAALPSFSLISADGSCGHENPLERVMIKLEYYQRRQVEVKQQFLVSFVNTINKINQSDAVKALYPTDDQAEPENVPWKPPKEGLLTWDVPPANFKPERNSERYFESEETPKSGQHDLCCWTCNQEVPEDAVRCPTCPKVFHTKKCSTINKKVRIPGKKPASKSKKRGKRKGTKSTQPAEVQPAEVQPAQNQPEKQPGDPEEPLIPEMISNEKSCFECRLVETDYFYSLHGEGGILNAHKRSKETHKLFGFSLNTVMTKVRAWDNRVNPLLYDMSEIYRLHPRSGLIYNRIDLKTMIMKQKKFHYTSVEQFMMDIKTLYHNIMILFPGNKIWWHHAEHVKSFALGEVNDIKQCEGCYRLYYESPEETTKAFTIPCNYIHGLVWVYMGIQGRTFKEIRKGNKKVKVEIHNNDNRKWWPAKVFKWRDENSFVFDEKYVDVKFFGGAKDERTLCVNIKYLRVYSRQPPTLTFNEAPRNRNRVNINAKEYDEALKHAVDYCEWLPYFFEYDYEIPEESMPFKMVHEDLFWPGIPRPKWEWEGYLPKRRPKPKPRDENGEEIIKEKFVNKWPLIRGFIRRLQKPRHQPWALNYGQIEELRRLNPNLPGKRVKRKRRILKPILDPATAGFLQYLLAPLLQDEVYLNYENSQEVWDNIDVIIRDEDSAGLMAELAQELVAINHLRNKYDRFSKEINDLDEYRQSLEDNVYVMVGETEVNMPMRHYTEEMVKPVCNSCKQNNGQFKCSHCISFCCGSCLEEYRLNHICKGGRAGEERIWMEMIQELESRRTIKRNENAFTVPLNQSVDLVEDQRNESIEAESTSSNLPTHPVKPPHGKHRKVSTNHNGATHSESRPNKLTIQHKKAPGQVLKAKRRINAVNQRNGSAQTGSKSAQSTSHHNGTPRLVSTSSPPMNPVSQHNGTPRPVSGTSRPVSGTPRPVSTSSQSMNPTSQHNGTPRPVSGKPRPVFGTPQPVSTSSPPLNPASHHNGTPRPVSGKPRPVSGTPPPVSTSSPPMNPTSQHNGTSRSVSTSSPPMNPSSQHNGTPRPVSTSSQPMNPPSHHNGVPQSQSLPNRPSYRHPQYRRNRIVPNPDGVPQSRFKPKNYHKRRRT